MANKLVRSQGRDLIINANNVLAVEKTIEIIFKHCTRKRFVKLIMGYYKFPKKKAEQIANDVRVKKGCYRKLDAILYEAEFKRGEK